MFDPSIDGKRTRYSHSDILLHNKVPQIYTLPLGVVYEFVIIKCLETALDFCEISFICASSH